MYLATLKLPAISKNTKKLSLKTPATNVSGSPITGSHEKISIAYPYLCPYSKDLLPSFDF